MVCKLIVVRTFTEVQAETAVFYSGQEKEEKEERKEGKCPDKSPD